MSTEDRITKLEAMVEAIDAHQRCQGCGKSAATEPHNCPFKEEIHGNLEQCNCCSQCQHDCCLAI